LIIYRGYFYPRTSEFQRNFLEMYLNGSDFAARGQFNYLAYIETIKFFCGAAILNEYWLMTAAHCVEKGRQVRITLGSTNLLMGENSEVSMRSKKYHIHENFSLPSAVADIAVIKLPKKLNFSEFIQPVKLPSRSYDFANASAILAGYGVFNNKGKKPYRVRYANFTVMTHNECVKYEKYFIETLTEENICAVGKSHVGESACSGILLEILKYTLKKKSCPHSRITSSKIFHESKKTGNLVRNLK
jgi:hypothetical protein